MKKVKCEVCGEMVPQNEMSKSYRHRCKKCVADMTRAQRHAEKQKKDAQENVPHTYEAPAPYGEGPLHDALLKMSEKEFDETISLAIKTYGKEAQTQMLFEEMAELQNALCKLARGRGSNDIERCTCRDILTEKDFENQRYNDVVKRLKQEISELRQENEMLRKGYIKLV